MVLVAVFITRFFNLSDGKFLKFKVFCGVGTLRKQADYHYLKTLPFSGSALVFESIRISHVVVLMNTPRWSGLKIGGTPFTYYNPCKHENQGNLYTIVNDGASFCVYTAKSRLIECFSVTGSRRLKGVVSPYSRSRIRGICL